MYGDEKGYEGLGCCFEKLLRSKVHYFPVGAQDSN